MTARRKRSRRTEGRRESGASLRSVGKQTGAYEPEGSERRALGSVSVAGGAWWSVTLTAPMSDGDTVLLTVERHGAMPAGCRAESDDVEIFVPAGELDAIVALLAGVVAQARRDGVLMAHPEAGT